jgi:hypothetical protein
MIRITIIYFFNYQSLFGVKITGKPGLEPILEGGEELGYGS